MRLDRQGASLYSRPMPQSPALSVLIDHVGELGFGDIPGWPAELAHGDIAIFCGLRKARRHARLIVISGRGTGSGQSGQEE